MNRHWAVLLSLFAASCAGAPPAGPRVSGSETDPSQSEKAPYQYCVSNLLARHVDALVDALIPPACVTRSGQSKKVHVRTTFEVGTLAATLQAYDLGILDAARLFGAEQLSKAALDRMAERARSSASAAGQASPPGECFDDGVGRRIQGWGDACATAAAHLDHVSYASGFSGACHDALQRTDCDAQVAKAVSRVDADRRVGLERSVAELDAAIRAFTHPR